MGEAFPPPFVVGVLDSPTMTLHILEPLLKSRTGFAEHREPTMEHGTPSQSRSVLKSFRAFLDRQRAAPQAPGTQGPRKPNGTQGPFGAPG